MVVQEFKIKIISLQLSLPDTYNRDFTMIGRLLGITIYLHVFYCIMRYFMFILLFYLALFTQFNYLRTAEYVLIFVIIVILYDNLICSSSEEIIATEQL